MKLIKLFITFSIFLISYSAFSSEVSVFCSSDLGKRKWLHEYDHLIKLVKIHGDFVEKEKNFTISNRYFTYFKINGTNSTIESLKLRCISTHGPDYKYVQVATSFFSEWYVIGLNDENIYPGFFSIYNYIGDSTEKENINNYINTSITNVDSIFIIK